MFNMMDRLSRSPRGLLLTGGVGVVAAIAGFAGSASAAALPQTVQVGTATVAVPSSGQIVVDGQTVNVMPGAKRVVLALAPAGSTLMTTDGTPDFQLPAGAVGESFTYPVGGLTLATTMPTQAVYPTTSETSPDSADSPTCEINAYAPSANGGQSSIKGTANLTCTGSGAAQTTVEVTATLYEQSSSGGSVNYRGATSSGVDLGEANATHTSACTAGETNFWHTRGDGTSTYDGLEVSYEDPSSSVPLVPCTS
jgi:hypothetical protein